MAVQQPPANPGNPNLILDPSNSRSNFKATDATNLNHFISGTLGGGSLEFVVVAQTPGQPRGVSERDYFAAMMAQFTPAAVSTIRGHWVAGLDLDTNLDQFNALVREGVSILDAAKRTWTGRRAMEYSFVNATTDFTNPPSSPAGCYVEVQVSFTR